MEIECKMFGFTQEKIILQNTKHHSKPFFLKPKHFSIDL